MKKILYSFLPLCLLGLSYSSSQAQSFTVAKDTAEAAAYGYLDLYSNIKNETSDTITVSWKIINHNLPQSWIDDAAFGLCDNVVCYPASILSGTVQVTDTISAGKESLFKMQVDVSPNTVVPAKDIYVRAELTNGTTVDTATFLLHKWATGVSKLNSPKDAVVLYPNPAKGDLNVTFNKELNVKVIAIFNLVGKQVGSYRVTNTSAKLDIEKIPSGIYFVRLIDNSGQVVVTRRFTHQ